MSHSGMMGFLKIAEKGTINRWLLVTTENIKTSVSYFFLGIAEKRAIMEVSENKRELRWEPKQGKEMDEK